MARKTRDTLDEGEAVALIAKSQDLAILKEWMEKDSRLRVQRALKDRIKALEAAERPKAVVVERPAARSDPSSPSNSCRAASTS